MLLLLHTYAHTYIHLCTCEQTVAEIHSFISALNSSTIFETSGEDVGQFLDCLDHHIKILDATVRMRKDFQDIVDNQDNMRIVHLPTWAGLGAVQ